MQTVPANFIKEHMERIPEDVTLTIKNRSWCVRLYTADRPAKFASGWWDFARDNKLEFGDHCIFEMSMQRANIVFEVTINRVQPQLS